MSPDWDYLSFSTDESVLERGHERVRIARNRYGHAPEDDGADPVLDHGYGNSTLLYGGRYQPPHPGHTDTDIPPEVLSCMAALDRWADKDIFERYVVAFHNGAVEWLNDSLVALALPEYRKRMHWLPAHLHEPPMVHDYKAYLDDDVWDICLERRVLMWQTAHEIKGGDIITRLADGGALLFAGEAWVTDDETWCGGYYGEEYAKQEAEALFTIPIDSKEAAA